MVPAFSGCCIRGSLIATELSLNCHRIVPELSSNSHRNAIELSPSSHMVVIEMLHTHTRSRLLFVQQRFQTIKHYARNRLAYPGLSNVL